MSLHVEVQGAGTDLVLLHGWGLHSGVWDEVAQALAQRYRVHCIDLPGHGRSPWNAGIHSLEQLAEAVAAQAPQPAVLVGWSLGGLVAMHLARRLPLRALVLNSSTPKFVAAPDWPHGMRTEVFAQFSTRLHADFQGTIEDFLYLQVRGDLNAPATLRTLKSRLLQHPPQEQALLMGLTILRDSDLRAELPHLRLPTLVVCGQHDRVTPTAAGRYLAEHLPQGRLVEIKRAGHAPFVSHRAEFLAELDGFLAQALTT